MMDVVWRQDELTCDDVEPTYDAMMAELAKRMSEGTFQFDQMTRIKVEPQPTGSMACGPATVCAFLWIKTPDGGVCSGWRFVASSLHRLCRAGGHGM
jgi:hypothetical protein